jgi:4-alpha-glucanotransferase
MEIIAEDLGFLTQEVFDLKKEANWPGLKIYEFAFSKDDMGKWENGYLPENYEADCVAYLGTHDNDTLQSFLLNCGDLKEVIFKNLKVKSLKSASKVMKERLVKSKSKLVIFMMQDILDEGGEYRFNTPSVASNNWRYRLNKNYSSVKNSNKISSLIKLGRR